MYFGFRETFGGLHKKYDVIPDMMMLGKTLGNGYAITAVLGTEEIMKFAQSTFISSTFWTERIGPCSCIKSFRNNGKRKNHGRRLLISALKLLIDGKIR